MSLETWQLDTTHSSITFSIRHLVISKVRGRFGKWTGSAQLRKRIAQRGVARKKDATVISLENVAVVAAVGIAPFARAPMFYAERGDVDLAGGR